LDEQHNLIRNKEGVYEYFPLGSSLKVDVHDFIVLPKFITPYLDFLLKQVRKIRRISPKAAQVWWGYNKQNEPKPMGSHSRVVPFVFALLFSNPSRMLDATCVSRSLIRAMKLILPGHHITATATRAANAKWALDPQKFHAATSHFQTYEAFATGVAQSVLTSLHMYQRHYAVPTQSSANATAAREELLTKKYFHNKDSTQHSMQVLFRTACLVACDSCAMFILCIVVVAEIEKGAAISGDGSDEAVHSSTSTPTEVIDWEWIDCEHRFRFLVAYDQKDRQGWIDTLPPHLQVSFFRSYTHMPTKHLFRGGDDDADGAGSDDSDENGNDLVATDNRKRLRQERTNSESTSSSTQVIRGPKKAKISRRKRLTSRKR